MDGLVGGPWGIINYKDQSNASNHKNKSNFIVTCCGRRVEMKKINQNEESQEKIAQN